MFHIYPQAQPFALEGDGVRCLLIHGFTGSPSEVRPLGEYLHGKGCSVRAPLLPGHGSTPEHLNRTTWQDWYQVVEDEAQAMLENGESVIAIGLSMGALLALELGVKLQKNISGIITINAPIIMRSRMAAWAPLVKIFKDFIPKQQVGSIWKELEETDRFAYDCIPVRAYVSMSQLRKHVVKRASEIEVPTLIIQSKRDELVDPRSAKMLYKLLDDRIGEIFLLQNSPHLATMGLERDILEYRVCEFIEKLR